MSLLHIKSKFDSEYRRFSIPINAEHMMNHSEFRSFIETVHSLYHIPFTLCYTSYAGDLLPITNDENFRKAFESSRPYLQLLIQRKGESWEEKYGYGTESADRKRKGLSVLIPSGSGRGSKRNYNISNPEDFRQVSSIIDVDVVPETHRRVRLCKYGETDRSLGFYIRDGTSLRMTSQGPVKCDGIFISRLLEGGLAESTGLLGVGDEVIEVNGIEVHGKTLDQVADMMVANAKNLVITIKPANQRNSLQRNGNGGGKGENVIGIGASPAQFGIFHQPYNQHRGESSSSSMVGATKLSNGGGSGGGGRVYPSGGPTPMGAYQSRPKYVNDFDDEDEEDEVVDHVNTALTIR